MTIGQVCASVERSRPGVMPLAEKIRHIAALECLIHSEIISRHEGRDIPFIPYDERVSQDRVLTCPDGYADIYIRYLEGQCDLLCGEIERYEGSAALFNSLWQAFLAFWRDSHRPKGAKNWKL